MKMDQIAFYCSDDYAADFVKRKFGLLEKEWIKDTVTARSRVYPNKEFAKNVGELQFNYDLGIELEILTYVEGPHWHQHMDNMPLGAPFISHIGIHLEDGEEFPNMHNCRLVQETFTESHTSEYLTTGAGAGRLYHYRIFEMGPETYIKYIRRIHPENKQ